MPIVMPDTFPISVAATCPSHSRTELKVRQHALTIDEPPERGGSDRAPTPLETLLSAYLGCTNVILNLIAEEMGIAVAALSMSLVGHFDTRGVFEKAHVTAPFPRIDLVVDIQTDAGDAEIEALRTALARRCPVSMILRQAGSDIVETWNVTAPRPGHRKAKP